MKACAFSASVGTCQFDQIEHRTPPGRVVGVRMRVAPRDGQVASSLMPALRPSTGAAAASKQRCMKLRVLGSAGAVVATDAVDGVSVEDLLYSAKLSSRRLLYPIRSRSHLSRRQ